MRLHRTIVPIVMGAALMTSSDVGAQATDNIAPRISLAGVSESVRADTLCVTIESGTPLDFPGLSGADADVGTAIMHARVELEPGAESNSSISIPGLADIPGVQIIREDFDRIRFDAPLASVAPATRARYEALVQGREA